MGILDHFTHLLYVRQEAAEQDGEMDWFKIGKGVHQAVYFHPACLTSMQSTSCEMPGLVNDKPESRLPGEIATSHMQISL